MNNASNVLGDANNNSIILCIYAVLAGNLRREAVANASQIGFVHILFTGSKTVEETPGRQHLLLRGKEDFQEEIWVKSGFKHHALFADTSLLCLSNKVKGGFTKDVQIEGRMLLPCS